MNLNRLMALGTLAQHGPAHGHQIRRLAEISNADEWGGVSVGALYRELRLMEAEGLVQAVRTEQVGRRPARTVYAITAEGEMELIALRVQAIRTTHPGPDTLAVALSFAFDGADRDELRVLLRARRDRLAVSASELAGAREHGVAAGYLTPVTAAVMRRSVIRMEAEVGWHDEFDQLLATLPPGGATKPGLPRPDECS